MGNAQDFIVRLLSVYLHEINMSHREKPLHLTVTSVTVNTVTKFLIAYLIIIYQLLFKVYFIT
jgi:hypothetical protein